MPFDTVARARGPVATPVRRSQRPVAVWLFVVCAMILVMVALGGATRLTGSGLSIMEWAPLRGALPPLSEAEWQRLYALYQQIPQYELVNKGFGLEGFKGIFWLEWLHRFWGRLMGVAFLVPLVWFALRGQIGRRLLPRLALFFVLGGLQGAVGWFMVASGFAPDSTAVSPYRLVVHLGLALVLYAAVLWTALDLWRQDAPRPAPAGLPAGVNAAGRPAAEPPPVPVSVSSAPSPLGLRRMLWATCALVGLTILAGGFVAGLKAGLTYNTFPLMDGRVVPEGYAALQPWWRNLTENVAAVQFNHRLLATLTAGFALATAAFGLRASGARPVRLALLALGGTVAVQYVLGVATLLLVVPVALGTAHQTGAVLVLTAALVALHLQRGAAR